MAIRKKLSSINEVGPPRTSQSTSSGARESDDLSDLIARVETTESGRPSASQYAQPAAHTARGDAKPSAAKPPSNVMSILIVVGSIALLAFAVYRVINKLPSGVVEGSPAMSANKRGSLLHAAGAAKVSSPGFASTLPKASLPSATGFRSNIQAATSAVAVSKPSSHIHSVKSHWHQIPTN